ncbi:DUF3429 domain-containing protein [Brevundimonas sp. SL130]|uniref:DUF3429 domain-containing protein n=1 Tax=Brevundimonas sp. SL130 TaxID=2995143 RepID=UPI00226D36A6|nr:DUF3429 domain-containing protein [Brevundimonas sp. SL130]WAC59732.1 DUF3429 domain-containing protein [Brevundimonas sp. SL130]
MTDRPALPPLARILGFAGLLPQAAAVAVLIFGGPDVRFAALSLAYAYAALIFSFLGGVWWGLAATARAQAPRWVWIAAVAPSLLALATVWPWASGQTWPGPSLIVLGVCLAASLTVDLRLKAAGLTPQGWLALRAPLSLGLGALTLAAGLI